MKSLAIALPESHDSKIGYYLAKIKEIVKKCNPISALVTRATKFFNSFLSIFNHGSNFSQPVVMELRYNGIIPWQ